MNGWTDFLNAMLLVLIRISGIALFAPFFSASALPVRAKAVFVGAVAFLIAPSVSGSPGAHAEITFNSIIGELAVGLSYGIVLSLLNEMLLFAGEIAGLQFSFSAVNLFDPTSTIQTTLMSNLFQLMGTLILVAAGLDRILLSSLIRSYHAVPLGLYAFSPTTAHAIVRAAGGIFLAAVELTAPILAATILAEITVALLSKLSPQLPVMSLTVPVKTLVGFTVLAGGLALWPRFIEARFAALLDMTERLLQTSTISMRAGLGG
jgi:flagellar biosynthesis protein FliR